LIAVYLLYRVIHFLSHAKFVEHAVVALFGAGVHLGRFLIQLLHGFGKPLLIGFHLLLTWLLRKNGDR